MEANYTDYKICQSSQFCDQPVFYKREVWLGQDPVANLWDPVSGDKV